MRLPPCLLPLCIVALSFSLQAQDTGKADSLSADSGAAQTTDTVAGDTPEGSAASPAEGPQAGKILDSLTIEGLVVNKPGVVRNSTGLKKGLRFTPADVQDAIRAIYRLGLFHSVDFFVAKETATNASLLLRVEEFPVCEGVEFSGMKKLKLKDLEELVNISAGRIVTDQAVRDNIKGIKQRYADDGHLNADIQATLEPSRIPGNATVKFKIKEGPRVRIKYVKVEGTQAYKASKVKRKFKTKEDRWWRDGKYDEAAYRENLDSLILWYQNHGYLDARVASDSVWFAPNNRDIHITVKVDEGKRYYAGEFFFAGNKVVSTDSLQRKVSLKKGKPFEKDKFDMTKYYVEDAYREEGYLWVQVKDERAYRGDTIDVTMQISEGKPAVVRKIDIKGNTKTRDKVVRRNIVLTPSQKYRQSLMSRSVREIMQLNYFNNVKPDLRPNDDGTIDMVFEVEEKDNIGQLSIGAAYSERDQFVGTFSTSIPNFRGNGQELTLNVEYGKYRQDYSIGFKEPWAFDRPISVSASVYYNYSKYATYSDQSQSYGFRLGAGRRLKWPDDYWRLDGMYQLSWNHESRRESYDTADFPIVIPQEGTLSRLSLTLYRNDTDIPQFPTRGSIFFLTPELAGLGGTFKYLKTTLGYDWYFPIFWKLVLGFRSKFGLINPIDDKLVISRWDLFNAGGVYSDGTIRGYPEYTFGGRDHPSDGISMLVMTTMLQFPLIDRQLYLSLFGDMGNTWSSVSKVDITDMYKGVGFGVRLMIPMLGLLGFDFAWRLDDPYRTPFANDPKDPFEFHFLLNRGF
jgi:outer membrane protein insertion porin family